MPSQGSFNFRGDERSLPTDRLTDTFVKWTVNDHRPVTIWKDKFWKATLNTFYMPISEVSNKKTVIKTYMKQTSTLCFLSYWDMGFYLDYLWLIMINYDGKFLNVLTTPTIPPQALHISKLAFVASIKHDTKTPQDMKSKRVNIQYFEQNPCTYTQVGYKCNFGLDTCIPRQWKVHALQ